MYVFHSIPHEVAQLLQGIYFLHSLERYTLFQWDQQLQAIRATNRCRTFLGAPELFPISHNVSPAD